jgi:hypothetical protein
MTDRMIIVLRVATAAVWIVFGLVFKMLQVVPRHERIVAAVIGTTWAGPVTIGIGAAEVLMGCWILSGRRPFLCASAQTVAVVIMNVLELVFAREHLLSPIAMPIANAVFLGLGWFLAVRTVADRRGA